MNEEERKIMELLVQVHNLFFDLPPQHPDEKKDWTNGVHDLQRIIMQRVVQRDYPKDFKCW